MKFIIESDYTKWFGGEFLIQSGEKLGILSYRKKIIDSAFATIDKQILLFKTWKQELFFHLFETWTDYIKPYCKYHNSNKLYDRILDILKNNHNQEKISLQKTIVFFQFNLLLSDSLKNLIKDKEKLRSAEEDLKRSDYSETAFIKTIKKHITLPEITNINRKYNILYYNAVNNRFFNESLLCEIEEKYKNTLSVYDKILFINDLHKDILIFNKGISTYRIIKNSLIILMEKLNDDDAEDKEEQFEYEKIKKNLKEVSVYEIWEFIKIRVFKKAMKKEIASIKKMLTLSLPFVKYNLNNEVALIKGKYEEIEKAFQSSNSFCEEFDFSSEKRDFYLKWIGGRHLINFAEKIGVKQYDDLIIDKNFTSIENKINFFKKWSDELKLHMSTNWRLYISEYCFRNSENRDLLIKTIDDPSIEINPQLVKKVVCFKYHHLLKETLYKVLSDRKSLRYAIKKLKEDKYSPDIFIRIIDELVELPSFNYCKLQCNKLYEFALKSALFSKESLDKIREEYSKISTISYRLDFLDNLKSNLKRAYRNKASKIYYSALCKTIAQRLATVYNYEIVKSMNENLQYLYPVLEEMVLKKSNSLCVEKYGKKLIRVCKIKELMKLNNIDNNTISKKIDIILKHMQSSSIEWFNILNQFFPQENNIVSKSQISQSVDELYKSHIQVP